MTAKFDLGVISEAPISMSDSADGLKTDTADLLELRHENSILQDENDSLKKEISVKSQKARLLIPYANKVFWFCVGYTLLAFSILFLHGYTSIPFKLDSSTMNFIAGSNLASVIGLLVIIAGGIFSSK